VTFDGLRVSTHDIGGNDGAYVLIAGANGDDWADAAQAAVGEIGDTGAILVRPDNHVGWRAQNAEADSGAVLGAALTSLLGRG